MPQTIPRSPLLPTTICPPLQQSPGSLRRQLPGAPAPPPQTPPPRRATGLLAQSSSTSSLLSNSPAPGFPQPPRPRGPNVLEALSAPNPRSSGVPAPAPHPPSTLAASDPPLPPARAPTPLSPRSLNSPLSCLQGQAPDRLPALPRRAPGLDLQVCQLIPRPPPAGSALRAGRELTFGTGLRHGFQHRPLPSSRTGAPLP